METKDVLDFYWKYFDLHSRQRMQMMGFYITIEVALIGGFFVLLNQADPVIWAEYCVLIAIGLMSVVFCLLDMRTRDLIHGCEECIEKFEKIYMANYDDSFKLMTKSRKQLESKKLGITYSFCFHITFCAMGMFALVCTIALYKGYI